MCVPIPVSDNVNKKGKITGGISTPAQGIVNQMLTPFRRAATGENLEEQRAKFTDPKSMAALLTMPDVYNAQRQQRNAEPAMPAVAPGAGKRDLTEDERRKYIGRKREPDTGGVSGADLQSYLDNKGYRRPY